MMKKIALIYMGGTFGCVGEPLSPMPAEQFLPQLRHVLPLHLSVECFVAPVIQDSSCCTAIDWLRLVQFIQQLQLQQFQHFVVIHGTDTLSYASAVLAHFIAQSAHVVLTGSQYPLLTIDGQNTRDFSDALDNLHFALESVLQLPVGVYLAFHHQCFHGRSALKCHTTELDAFQGQAASSALNQKEQTAYLVQTADLDKAQHFNCMSVMMQPIGLEQQLANLKLIAQQPPHCLILQGFGTGNLAVDEALLALLQSLQTQDCAVILTTQVPFGPLDQRYAISSWIQNSKILVNDGFGHADLYAKALKMYLQYPRREQWQQHWYD